MNLMGTGRHSSSSLSSHASSEAGNVVMLGDSSMGEAPEDLYHHMQVPELSKRMGQALDLEDSPLCWLISSEGWHPYLAL